MIKRLFLVLMIISISVCVFAGGQPESDDVAVPLETVDGIIEYFDGEVTVNGESADFGMKVPYGAVIKTGPEAYCEVVFSDRNIFRINESTVTEIMLAVGSPEIRIEQGAVASLFSKLDALTSDEPFRVRTQTAMAGVRGTAFFIKVIDPDTTYICLCNGELELSPAEGGKPGKYSAGHHTAVYFRNIDGTTEIEDAPMLYHTDEDMESLADHIGEEIYWYY